jgi:hypothetical protein
MEASAIPQHLHSEPWGRMVTGKHVCQVYASDAVFLDALAGYVDFGLRNDEAVIVIATDDHVKALEGRIGDMGGDGRLITLGAHETLRQFMVNGWPDEQRFMRTIGDVIRRARGDGRGVRAFGEMVSLLWNKGHYAATVHLEHLWNRLLENEQLSLFCAYPRSCFTKGPFESIDDLNSLHSRVIAA